MRKICLLLLVVSLPVVAHARPLRFSGDAVVRSIGPAKIAVFVDTNADQVIDQGFLLTTDVSMGDLAVRVENANVIFTDGYLRVATAEKVYDLQVAGFPEPPSAPKGTEVVSLIGSALTHSSGDSGCDIKRALEGDAGGCYAYGKE